MSQGGFTSDAEQTIPEQFTVSGSSCRDLEPTLRISEQLSLRGFSDEQLATSTETEEENSGTYNLEVQRTT